MSEYNELDALIKAVDRQQQVDQVENFLRNYLQPKELAELEQVLQKIDLIDNPVTATEIEQNTTKRMELLELCTNMDMSKLFEMALNEASVSTEPERERSHLKDRSTDELDRGF